MKVGLGLYRHMLTRQYYDFARQAGCTHVVVHLVDYFNQGPSNPRNNFVRSKIGNLFEVLKPTKSRTSTSTTTRTMSESRNLG